MSVLIPESMTHEKCKGLAFVRGTTDDDILIFVCDSCHRCFKIDGNEITVKEARDQLGPDMPTWMKLGEKRVRPKASRKQFKVIGKKKGR